MKRIILTLALALGTTLSFAQVGVGTTSPDASSALDVTSTTKGFLPPRMTTAERDAIASPAEGLAIYNTSVNCVEIWNAIGWVNICGGRTLTGLQKDCENDVTTGSGAIVQMLYNYDGVFNKYDYVWCAREITQAMEDAAHPISGTNLTGPAPLSGKTWLDRNLGAYQVANNITDAASYGDLYQWGRSMDGHAKRVQRTGNLPEEGGGAQSTAANGTTTTQADTPTNALFIAVNIPPRDWRVNKDDALWSGIGAVNNPCPAGYYVPTNTQLQTLEDWLDDETDRRVRAVEDTELNIPTAGRRRRDTGVVQFSGGVGYLWSSSVGGSGDNFASFLFFNSTTSGVSPGSDRGYGYPLRCIRD